MNSVATARDLVSAINDNNVSPPNLAMTIVTFQPGCLPQRQNDAIGQRILGAVQEPAE